MKRILIIVAAALALGACCGKTTDKAMDYNFLSLASERYSVRSFSATPVEEEKIDRIIEAGRLAPTAINSQPQKIYVAKSAEAMEKLNALSPCMYGAPHCFVFCYNDETVCKRGEDGNYGDIDVTIVLTHMALEAASIGVGTCIVGYFDRAQLAETLGLPEGIHPVLLMPFGYAAPDCTPSPRHTDFRPLEETVEEI